MRDRHRAARATRPACALLLLAAAACSTIFGTRHRDVQIEVHPTVFRVVHHHQAGRPDEQTSESLEDSACLRDEPASCWVEELMGIYRVGFTLSDEDGELPERLTLSEPFELRR